MSQTEEAEPRRGPAPLGRRRERSRPARPTGDVARPPTNVACGGARVRPRRRRGTDAAARRLHDPQGRLRSGHLLLDRVGGRVRVGDPRRARDRDGRPFGGNQRLRSCDRDLAAKIGSWLECISPANNPEREHGAGERERKAIAEELSRLAEAQADEVDVAAAVRELSRDPRRVSITVRGQRPGGVEAGGSAVRRTASRSTTKPGRP